MENSKHFEKYDAIARLIGIERLIQFIPATREEVSKALQSDENLNNINLHAWDAKHGPVQQMARAAKAGWGESRTAWTLCETVCTLKHVAKNYYVKSRAGWDKDRRDLGQFVQVGDYVDQEMADYFLCVLPPACMSGGLIQIGEPNSHVNGRATFATIQTTAEGWVYRGNCYRGQATEPVQLPGIYAEVKAAGGYISNHESDLYIEDTAENRAILDRYPTEKSNAKRFKNEVTGAVCIDIPFAFMPFWEAKAASRG